MDLQARSPDRRATGTLARPGPQGGLALPCRLVVLAQKPTESVRN
jgi:hypothetical protein